MVAIYQWVVCMALYIIFIFNLVRCHETVNYIISDCGDSWFNNEDTFANMKCFLFDMLMLTLLVSCGFWLGLEYNNNGNTFLYSFSNETSDIPLACNNLSLIKTSDCMVRYVAPFFNYTIRTDVPRTLEDIKTNGGDCYDYSLLYVDMARELGFIAKQIKIEIIKENGHAVAMVSDKTGYCVIDQIQRPYCVALDMRLKNESAI